MCKIECNYAIQINKDYESIANVHSGEELFVKTVNAYGYDFNHLVDLKDLIDNKYSNKHHHPLTGPINVVGAHAGDTIKVSIIRILPEKMAQALSKSAGVDLPDINCFASRSPIIASFNEKSNDISYIDGLHIFYKPMIGMIATAPAEGFIKTGHAGKTGGNLDIPFITEHTSVYLPVEVEGAQLFIGDVHGAQGYGELSGVALEMDSGVSLKVEILHPRYKLNHILVVGNEPYANKCAIGIVGIATHFQDLNEAVFNAYYGALEVLSRLFPTMNKHNVGNLLTLIGHSLNGQAFSHTSESTSIINIFEDDIKKIKNDKSFSLVKEIENILFCKKNVI